MLKLLSFVFLLSVSAYGQYSWLNVDTLTAGDCDDLNPQVDHAGIGMTLSGLYSGPITEEWTVFERWKDGIPSIAAVKFRGDQLVWDPSVSIVSPAETGTVKKYPDVCTNQRSISLAAWQQKTGSVWNIYYSLCNIDSGNWSAPAALTSNTVSNANVEVRPLSDSSFILLWRKGSSILCSIFQNGQPSQTKTLVASNCDSTEYDFASQFVWTRVDSSGKRFCLLSNITDVTNFSLSLPDTISCVGDMSDPQFMSSSAERPFTFDFRQSGKREAWQAFRSQNWDTEKLAGDISSSYCDAVFFVPPLLTGAHTGSRKIGQISPFGFYAWEKETGTDTSVVFVGSAVDSLEPGRNPSISPLSFYEGNKTSESFVVWESNRTGRYHIYSRGYVWVQTGIDEPNPPASAFMLSQNYPNPFNPTTTICYRLSAVSDVTIKVYDALGREVRTLVDGRQTPGEHSVTFDSRGLASGVYFYQLRTGNFRDVKRMMLIK